MLTTVRAGNRSGEKEGGRLRQMEKTQTDLLGIKAVQSKDKGRRFKVYSVNSGRRLMINLLVGASCFHL